ncbi:MAG TPA: CsbD family protein [Chryseolinea sp.]|nr:CsbD family protein [Chryseolinea sp.]HPM31436.1 CsbD family protein [Chryseolinea sp.]
MNTLQLKGSWKEIKGKLKQKYAQLTDDDLMFEEGMEDELIGRIEKRIGKTKEEIQKEIENLSFHS